MIRSSTALCALAVILVGYALFQVKYEVMQQEDQLAHIKQQIADSRDQVRILTAEWSFLTQPTRLDQLAKRYLDLVPIGTAQLGSIDQIPLRNPPPAATQSPSQLSAPARDALAILSPSTAP